MEHFEQTDGNKTKKKKKGKHNVLFIAANDHIMTHIDDEKEKKNITLEKNTGVKNGDLCGSCQQCSYTSAMDDGVQLSLSTEGNNLFLNITCWSNTTKDGRRNVIAY